MTSEMDFSVGNSGQRIVFTPEVLRHFFESRQKHCWQTETGGQLFATLSPTEIRILKATGPTRGDLRSRFGFRPDRRRQQREINQMRELGLHFVGDWHTHPQRFPEPSPVDVSSIHDCVRESVHDLNAFLLVVIGTEEFPRGLFVALSDGHVLTKLECTEDFVQPIQKCVASHGVRGPGRT